MLVVERFLLGGMKVLVLLVLGACGSKVPPGWDESTSAASAGCLWFKGSSWVG